MNSTQPLSTSSRAISGSLRFSNGAQVDAAPSTAAGTAPPQAVPDRQGEQVFIVLQLPSTATPDLYEDLIAAATTTYWETPGSTTKALRKAAIATNSRLAQINSKVDALQQCVGSLAWAVLNEDDIFILQAGQVSAVLLHRGRLQEFTASKSALPLGSSQVADVRVHHAFSAIGDTLLLAVPNLTLLAGGESLDQLMAAPEVPSVLSGLAQSASESDFTAMVARRPEASQLADAPRIVQPSAVPAADFGQPEPPVEKRRRRVRTRVKKESRLRIWAQEKGPKIRARLSDASEVARSGLSSAGSWLAQGAKTLFRRTLPGREENAIPSVREAPAYPVEKRSLMRAFAIGIPVLLVVLVAVAYYNYEEARFQSKIQRAQQEMDLATAADDPEEARSHLEQAFALANEAKNWRPENPDAVRIYTEAENALDALSHVARISAIPVLDFIEDTSLSRIVVRGPMVFVLDSDEKGFVIRLDLNASGDSLATAGSLTELVESGDQIGVDLVADLVDCAWVDTAGGRQVSGLLILDTSGGLFTYDPSWTGAGGGARINHSQLRDVLADSVRAVGTYQGRFYMLDPIRNQIWRYIPEGDVYPYPPEEYFSSSPTKNLNDAIDMAINGNIYVLYDDGKIIRFTGDESQTFDLQGMTGDLKEATAIAIDPVGLSGHIYVADPGNDRIVVLGADGTFLVEYRTQNDVSLAQLSTIAVDETAGRFYFVSGQVLYSAPLP